MMYKADAAFTRHLFLVFRFWFVPLNHFPCGALRADDILGVVGEDCLST
jgi:hypothetical protein